MKVRDLFEVAQYDDSSIVYYTGDKLASVPKVSASNVEDVYNVEGIIFDNNKGLGATPINANIVYLGFVAEIRASDFLNLALPAERGKDARRIKSFIEKGAAIAAPFLTFKYNEKEFEDGHPIDLKISNHEGRARTTAFRILAGDEYIPVQFESPGGRARFYNKDFFENFREEYFTSQSGNKIKPDIRKIFWMGEEI